MRRSVFLYLFLMFSMIGLTSCGSGGSDFKSETNKPIVSTNSEGNVVVKGKIFINANSSDNFTIKLTDIVFKNDVNSSCILDYSPSQDSEFDVTNGAEIDYEVTINSFCKDVDSLIFEADKIVSYRSDEVGEKSRVERYSEKIEFEKISYEDYFNIESNYQIVKIGQNNFIEVRVVDDSGSEIRNEDIVKVTVKSSDSTKLTLLNEQNGSVSEVVYENLSYKKIGIEAKNSGSVKITIEALLKIGSSNYKIRKDFDIEIEGSKDFLNKKFNVKLAVAKSLVVDSIAKFTVEIRDSESDEFIDNSYVANVTVSTLRGLVKFSSENRGDLSDNYNKDSFVYDDENSKVIYVKSGKISGLETFRVDVVLDINGSYEENISQEFTIPIVSGAPNTISLIYVDSSYSNGLYSDRYRIQAIDRYGNPARVNSKIYVGAVSGLTKDDENKDIFVKSNSNINGTLKKSDLGVEFRVDRSDYFKNVSIYDTLIVLSDADRLDSSYLGGWIVKDKIDNSRLLLEGDFNVTETTNISFLIGDEKRYDPCEQQPKSVDFDSEDNTYELQEDGTAYFVLRYPPFMVGKDVYLYANSYDEKRVGVSMRKKLFGTGVSANSVSCTDGSKCDKISFTLNNSSYRLLSQELDPILNFSYSGDCDISRLPNRVDTACSGVIDLNVYADINGSCTIKWDNSIPYEH